ncbi:MAG: A24 family peptidase [Dehalococcoidia bacterium]
MTVLAALIGLLLGHALDVFFDRLYTDRPLGGPVYRCPHCRQRPRPLDLIPLVGLLWSRGRCPHCGRRLPLHAFLFAPGAAALFTAAELIVDGFGPALLTGFFATVFLALTFTDLERRLIPNRVVYTSILLAAALSWAWPDTSVTQVFAGALVAVIIAAGLILFSLPFGANAFGMGDVKMIVLMGVVTGLPSVIVGVLVGTFAAGAAAALLLLLRVVNRRDYIPHGPFLALGAVVALLWGDAIWDWYFDR